MIAYLFLVYDIIERYDIWNEYFKNKDNYIVIIHYKFFSNNKYTFKYIYTSNLINTINKTNINIVRATLLLMKEALKYNITHIVFLSGNCIPLYNYDILNNFIKNCKYSIIDCKYGVSNDRYYKLNIKLKYYIKYNQFVKQQPNMILIKNDILKFIKNDYTYFFKDIICPDEHYFINIALYILKLNIIKTQINFCNIDLNKTQALEYKNININFLNNIRNKGFLFMRKVNKFSYIKFDFLK